MQMIGSSWFPLSSAALSWGLEILSIRQSGCHQKGPWGHRDLLETSILTWARNPEVTVFCGTYINNRLSVPRTVNVSPISQRSPNLRPSVSYRLSCAKVTVANKRKKFSHLFVIWRFRSTSRISTVRDRAALISFRIVRSLAAPIRSCESVYHTISRCRINFHSVDRRSG